MNNRDAGASAGRGQPCDRSEHVPFLDRFCERALHSRVHLAVLMHYIVLAIHYEDRRHAFG